VERGEEGVVVWQKGGGLSEGESRGCHRGTLGRVPCDNL
jgi:hypothetical protein